MSKPVVAIVGRPNVGKSSLFNTLYGERISIVHDTPGVTRDRIYAQAQWRGRDFMIIDTGGIEPGNDEDIILKQMRIQAEIAIETADVIIQDDSLSKLVTAVRIGKYTRRIIWQNIILAFLVKFAILALGTVGVATLWEAVFADSGVALLAIFNAMRINRLIKHS